MPRTVTALVPLKRYSRRLPDKNLLDLGGKYLFEHIFETLHNVNIIEEIYAYCSTDFPIHLLPSFVKVLGRPRRLDGDDVKANELFSYAIKRVKAEIILIAHATSPFTTADSILRCIKPVSNKQYSTSLTAQSLKAYAWHNQKPINYDPDCIAQTQDISPILVENSGVYCFEKSHYISSDTRVNKHSLHIVPVGSIEGIDIDTPEDYALAKTIFNNRHSIDSCNIVTPHNVTLPEPNRTAALVFDFDGVIINTLPIMKSCWQEVMSEYGLDPNTYSFDQYRKYVGLPFMDILARLGLSDSCRMHSMKGTYFRKAKELIPQSTPFSGLPEVIRDVSRRMPCALLTSKDRDVVHNLLRTLGLHESFNVILTPNDLPDNCSKPSPYGIIRICHELKVSPKDCVYFGDTHIDFACAQAAGSKYVHCAWGISGPVASNCYQLVDPQDIREYIQEL